MQLASHWRCSLNWAYLAFPSTKISWRVQAALQGPCRGAASTVKLGHPIFSTGSPNVSPLTPVAGYSRSRSIDLAQGGQELGDRGAVMQLLGWLLWTGLYGVLQ